LRAIGVVSESSEDVDNRRILYPAEHRDRLPPRFVLRRLHDKLQAERAQRRHWPTRSKPDLAAPVRTKR